MQLLSCIALVVLATRKSRALKENFAWMDLPKFKWIKGN